MDNKAGKTGQSVFSCGYYDDIYNNYWGGANPAASNDQIIEWSFLKSKNIPHVDKDPLEMVLALSRNESVVGEQVIAWHLFQKSDGDLLLMPIFNDEVVFDADGADLTASKKDSLSMVNAYIIPHEAGDYVISADLYGKILSEVLHVYSVNITAPDISAYYGGTKTLNIHLDGNENAISKQNVVVSFNSKYYNARTDENGDASVLINSLPDSLGTYDISISVADINATSAITILSTIEADDFSTFYGDDTPFEVKFLNREGQIAKRGTLTGYQIDDSRAKYGGIQGDDGIIPYDISSLEPGNHSFKVLNLLTKENKTFTVSILSKYASSNNLGIKSQVEDTLLDANLVNENLFNDISVNGNLNTLVYNYLSSGASLIDEAAESNSTDVANQSASNPPVKTVDNQSDSGNSNLLWILLLIVIVAAAAVLIKKYKG